MSCGIVHFKKQRKLKFSAKIFLSAKIPFPLKETETNFWPFGFGLAETESPLLICIVNRNFSQNLVSSKPQHKLPCMMVYNYLIITYINYLGLYYLVNSFRLSYTIILDYLRQRPRLSFTKTLDGYLRQLSYKILNNNFSQTTLFTVPQTKGNYKDNYDTSTTKANTSMDFNLIAYHTTPPTSNLISWGTSSNNKDKGVVK